MKILYILSGAEIGTFYRALFWAKFLNKRGHSVTLICAHPQPSYSIFKIKYSDNVRIINLFRTYQRWDFIGYLFRAVIVFFLCAAFEADIVHSFVVWQPPSMMALLFTRLLQILGLRKSIILADWDDWWGIGGIADEHGSFLRKSITFLEKKMPNFANMVTIVSKNLAERAVSVGVDRGKISIIPNGADVENINVVDNVAAKIALGYAPDTHILTYMGNSHLPQFFSMMFSALERAAANVKDVVLLVVGNIPIEYKNNIKDSIKDRVIFMGRRPRNEIPSILGASDVLLLPMVANVEEESRWPIRFGEYLAAGRPIVSNAVGEIKNIIETYKCGIVSDYNNQEDFSSQIIKILSQKAVQIEIGKRARNIAETVYSWNIIVGKLEELYTNTYRDYFNYKFC